MNKKLYIFRNEGVLALKEIRTNTKTLNPKFDQIYKKLWYFFIKNLTKVIKKYIGAEIKIVIHDHISLEKEKKKLIGDSKIITMDSYNTLPNAFKLGVSRIFPLAGKEKLGIGQRPGYASIEKQIGKIRKEYKNQEFTLVDDDIFSGGTLKKISDGMKKKGVKIKKIVVGTKIGKNMEIDLPILSVHVYKPSQVFELNDPRDFLFGSFEGGLVIKMEKVFCRGPYILPFVDVKQRVGVSKEKALEFSKEITDLNRIFFENLEKAVRVKIKLSHASKTFTKIVKGFYKIKKDISLLEVCELVMSDLEKI